MSRFPMTSFPNGWFLVAQTHELPAKGVLSIRRFGRELVLFRGESGTPNMLDAHCPHLGAHLGEGGCVKGETLECPFHAWRFNGEGQCTEIPYSQKIPRQAKTRAWHVRELHGIIVAWHHSEGLPPNAEPIIPEENDGTWSPGVWKQWKVRTHVQEILENGVDCAHFRPIHLSATEATCEAFFLENGMMRTVVESALDIMGTKEMDKLVHTRSEVLAIGLSFSLTINTAGPMRIRVFVAHTPLDEEFVDFRARLQVNRMGDEQTTLGAEALSAPNLYENIERDIRIWENKVYRNPPVLCEGDGPIGKARQWAKQFYSGGAVEQTQDKEQAA